VTASAAELAPAVVQGMVSLARERRYRPPSAIALRGRPRWSGPPILEAGGERVRVVPCVSALAVREALLHWERDSWLVVITDRDQDDLGPGLLARLVGRRVMVPSLWEVVRDRFHAQQIDPTLVREDRALAEALLAEAPPEGWPPGRGGVLTRDAAMAALAARVLGLAADRVDPAGLLEWTLDRSAVGALARLTEPAREGLLRWLGERTGPAGRCTLGVVRTGNAVDALPLALIAGLLVDPGVEPVRAAETRGILAHRYGRRTPSGEVAGAWEETARGLVERRLGGDDRIAERLSRAEVILGAANALDLADRSPVLRRGFDARLRHFARTVREILAGGRCEAAEGAFAEVARHLLAEHEPLRASRAHMALRLVRWLSVPSPPSASLSAAVERYIGEDSWVDRARAAVWVGDGDPDVAAAYGQLYTAASERRRVHDERFGRLLAEETARPGPPRGVEDVLRTVVLPLARAGGRVLLLVVDGMSGAVATELAEGIARDGWSELLPHGARGRMGVLAALPSTTAVSRTTLFCGTVRAGGQEDERTGLERLTSEVGARVRLFHKVDLDRSAPGETLPDQVRRAVEDRRFGVVAAVLNTIDDALDRADVGGTAWDLDRVRHLRSLLQLARYVGRLVVLASDHGHVLDRRDGEQQAHPGVSTQRWRPAQGSPGPAEVLLAGRRVVGGPVIAPWREDVRYGAVRAGYHGGASPAEVVCPLLVYGMELPDGWDLAPPQAPGWWLSGPTAPLGANIPESSPAAPEQPSLFELSGDLADAVLRSRVYAEQRARAYRTQLEDERVLAMLRALLGAGGRLPREALAAASGTPLVRMPGMLAALQRLLNVEGYEVVGTDADGTTVVLDEALLREQFGVGRGG
jgi:hypothetical protein